MSRKPKPSFYYNCKPSGDQYRITKFDTDANPESSYLTDGIECDCPAGVRPTCRHRQMLPLFKASKATNGEAFFNFDTSTWIGGEESPSDDMDADAIAGTPEPIVVGRNRTATEIEADIARLKSPSPTPPRHTSTGLRRI